MAIKFKKTKKNTRNYFRKNKKYGKSKKKYYGGDGDIEGNMVSPNDPEKSNRHRHRHRHRHGKSSHRRRHRHSSRHKADAPREVEEDPRNALVNKLVKVFDTCKALLPPKIIFNQPLNNYFNNDNFKPEPCISVPTALDLPKDMDTYGIKISDKGTPEWIKIRSQADLSSVVTTDNKEILKKMINNDFEENLYKRIIPKWTNYVNTL